MPRIFHPTDLSNDREAAFLIALRLSLASHSVLTLMHVADDREADPADMPAVRATLARWGRIASPDDKAGFDALHIGVRKVIRDGRNPLKACLDHLDHHPTDLIVLATHQGQGLRTRRVAEPLGRSAGVPTLFVPKDAVGLVDANTGEVRMLRLLVPVDHHPDPRRAMEAAMTTADLLGIQAAHFSLLFVGDAADAPRVEVPLREGWTMDRLERQGEVVPAIVSTAKEIGADVVVMATQGHDGFLDALRGSTTERVLREVSCPVLAVPAQA